jgi:hypothetical protein
MGQELQAFAVLRAAGTVVELGALVAAHDDGSGCVVGVQLTTTGQAPNRRRASRDPMSRRPSTIT